MYTYIPHILYYIYSSIKWAGRPDAAHDKSIPDRLQPRSSFALYVDHAAKTSNNFSNIDIGMYIILHMSSYAGFTMLCYVYHCIHNYAALVTYILVHRNSALHYNYTHHILMYTMYTLYTYHTLAICRDR